MTDISYSLDKGGQFGEAHNRVRKEHVIHEAGIQVPIKKEAKQQKKGYLSKISPVLKTERKKEWKQERKKERTCC